MTRYNIMENRKRPSGARRGGVAMKLLSVAVPCYNSAAYMRRCVDSLLPGGEEVEILSLIHI